MREAKTYPTTQTTEAKEPKRLGMLRVARITYDHIPLIEGEGTIGAMVDAYLADAKATGTTIASLHLSLITEHEV